MLKIYHFLQKTNQYFVTELYNSAFYIIFKGFSRFSARKIDKIRGNLRKSAQTDGDEPTT